MIKILITAVVLQAVLYIIGDLTANIGLFSSYWKKGVQIPFWINAAFIVVLGLIIVWRVL